MVTMLMASVLSTQQDPQKIVVQDLRAHGFDSLEGRDRTLPHTLSFYLKGVFKKK